MISSSQFFGWLLRLTDGSTRYSMSSAIFLFFYFRIFCCLMPMNMYVYNYIRGAGMFCKEYEWSSVENELLEWETEAAIELAEIKQLHQQNNIFISTTEFYVMYALLLDCAEKCSPNFNCNDTNAKEKKIQKKKKSKKENYTHTN